MIKKSIMLITLAFCFSVSIAFGEQANKVGSVNLEKALYQSQTGKAALDDLKKDFDDKQNLIAKKEGEIKEIESELLTQRLILSEAMLKEKEDKYKRKIKELERMRDDLQQELDKKKNEVFQELLKRIKKIIQDIGQEGGYSFVMENSLLLYQSPTLDLTDAVIKKFDEKTDEKNKK